VSSSPVRVERDRQQRVPIRVDNWNPRPPSRHKDPPKAIHLDAPLELDAAEADLEEFAEPRASTVEEWRPHSAASGTGGLNAPSKRSAHDSASRGQWASRAPNLHGPPRGRRGKETPIELGFPPDMPDQEAVVEDTNMRCKDKKLGRPDSQSALFPKAESPQMDFGIPWGAATHSGGWTEFRKERDRVAAPTGLEVSGWGLAAHGGSPGQIQAPIAPSPNRLYKQRPGSGPRTAEMQVEDLEEPPARGGAGASMRHWQPRSSWEPRSDSRAASGSKKRMGRQREKPRPARAEEVRESHRGPTPLGGPKGHRGRRSSQSSGTLPFETSLAPEFLSLFAS
jgi:hypothetical protein